MMMIDRTLFKARWSAMAARERRMVALAIALVVLALLWWVALGPALRTLAAAPAEHARLDAQLQRMTTLQAQAKALQAQPRSNREDALRALESSVRETLGANARLASAGNAEFATVTVRTASADNLARWLAQARANARAVPNEAHLTRSPAAPAPGTETTGVRWDGTLVMSLPAAR